MSEDQDCDRIVEAVKGVLAQPLLHEALLELLDPAQHGVVERAIQRMHRKEAYVAVIGSQGAGKSTFLNSLLFPVRTLPVGEGVTTNIVCYIRDSAGGEKRSEIALRTGEVLTRPLNRETLEEYMDEGRNPGNRRGVTQVTCFTSHPWLETATVFVDTPGLASYVKSHGSVTMAFAHKMSLALCVLHTTPTLLDTEARFLANIWPLCSTMIFVQNVRGEDPEEVEASLRDNARQLSEIAAGHGDRRPIVLLPVNIHEAMHGVANEEPDRVRQSGLGAVQAAIAERITRGGRRLEIALQSQDIMRCLQLAIAKAGAQAEAAATRDEPSIRHMRQDVEDEADKLSTIKTDHRNREQNFNRNCRNAVADSKQHLEARIEPVRAAFVDRTDRPDLESEYQTQLIRAASSVANGFSQRLFDTCDAFLEATANDIESIVSTMKLSAEQRRNWTDLSGLELGEIFGNFAKWGGTLTLTALTAASAATFAGAMAAGSTVGSAVAAGAATIPVLGWAIGAAILAGGVVVKGAIKEKKRVALVAAINTAARDYIDRTGNAISSEADRIKQQVLAAAQSRFTAIVAQQESILQTRRDTLNKSEMEKRKVAEKARERSDVIEAAIREIARLTQPAAQTPAASAAE